MAPTHYDDRQGPAAMGQDPAPPSAPMNEQPGIMENAQQAAGGNEILSQIVEKVDGKVPPELQETYAGIVDAGLELMSAQQTKGEFRQLLDRAGEAGEAERPKIYAHGVVKALTMISNEAGNGQDPNFQQEFVNAAPLAGMTMMAYALSVAESMGQPMSNELIAETAKNVQAGFFAAFKIDGEQVRQAMQGGQPMAGGAAQQPGAAQPPPQPAQPGQPAQPASPGGMV